MTVDRQRINSVETLQQMGFRKPLMPYMMSSSNNARRFWARWRKAAIPMSWID
jgi:hypothetical protein